MAEATAWHRLINELDLWQNAGKTANFWWRDDDAIEHTSQLEQLDQFSRKHQVPVSIAVIPARLQDSLADYLDGRHHFQVLQHGYAHRSHAAKGVKKIELGGELDNDNLAGDLRAGFDIMKKAFVGHFIPVLVPPWNRIEERCFDVIKNTGFAGVSSMWARKKAYPTPGLLQVNTHLDPVNWRHDRGFIHQHAAIRQLYIHLLGRRTGYLDEDEPTGILTHHLDQTELVWDFCDRLFSLIAQHPAATWTDAATIWT
ncbi:MAG: hypothetical protein GY806_16830 [Gammaproteobacteria bacterium]|nr:hypothetical protein [Gammaproteobacteria bacterium]